MSQEKRDNKPLTGHSTSGRSGSRRCWVPSAAFEPFKYANVAMAKRNFNSFALLVSVKLLHANLHV